jgi:hypothetical protein
MQSQIVALLSAEGEHEATLLVRRGNGQFFLERMDARLGRAARLAASYAPSPLYRSLLPEVCLT